MDDTRPLEPMGKPARLVTGISIATLAVSVAGYPA